VKTICKTKLNGKNLMKAINTMTTPVLVYSFGVIPWSDTELNELQIKTRTTLSRFKYHHPKATIERTMLPRKEGSRGLLDMLELRDKQMVNMRKYFQKKRNNSQLLKEMMKADKKLAPLNLDKDDSNLEHVIKERRETRVNTWRGKALHGRFYSEFHSPYVDKQASCTWLQKGTYTLKQMDLL